MSLLGDPYLNNTINNMTGSAKTCLLSSLNFIVHYFLSVWYIEIKFGQNDHTSFKLVSNFLCFIKVKVIGKAGITELVIYTY